MKPDTCRSRTGAGVFPSSIALVALFLLMAIPARALADDSWKPVVAAMQAQIVALQKQVQTLQAALSSKAAQNALTLGQYVSVTQHRNTESVDQTSFSAASTSTFAVAQDRPSIPAASAIWWWATMTISA